MSDSTSKRKNRKKSITKSLTRGSSNPSLQASSLDAFDGTRDPTTLLKKANSVTRLCVPETPSNVHEKRRLTKIKKPSTTKIRRSSVANDGRDHHKATNSEKFLSINNEDSDDSNQAVSPRLRLVRQRVSSGEVKVKAPPMDDGEQDSGENGGLKMGRHGGLGKIKIRRNSEGEIVSTERVKTSSKPISEEETFPTARIKRNSLKFTCSNRNETHYTEESMEEILKDPDEANDSLRMKSRTTVDARGRIRRVRKNVDNQNFNGHEGEVKNLIHGPSKTVSEQIDGVSEKDAETNDALVETGKRRKSMSPRKSSHREMRHSAPSEIARQALLLSSNNSDKNSQDLRTSENSVEKSHQVRRASNHSENDCPDLNASNRSDTNSIPRDLHYNTHSSFHSGIIELSPSSSRDMQHSGHSNNSRMTSRSNHSENSRIRRSPRGARRALRRRSEQDTSELVRGMNNQPSRVDDVASPLGTRKSLIESKSPNPLSDVEMSEHSLRLPEVIQRVKSRDIDLVNEVKKLREKVDELSAENLTAEHKFQAESAQLRQDLRAAKRDIQHYRNDRQQLQESLNLRDEIIDESEERIKALERAVESQLDVVEDLEEELGHANDEILALESKLAGMEKGLNEPPAFNDRHVDKITTSDKNQIEALDRRLDEREKELVAREARLDKERKKMAKNTKPRRDLDNLERDNRILVMALDREKAQVAIKLRGKEDEIAKLRQELELASSQPNGQVGNVKNQENDQKIKQTNETMQLELNAMKQELAEARKARRAMEDRMEEELEKRNNQMQVGSTDKNKKLLREMDDLKAELRVMQSKFEGALQRNHLLEDDIDHWKSVNCSLEDEAVGLKSEIVIWRHKFENAINRGPNKEPFTLPFNSTGHHSQALQRRRDDDDEHSRASASTAGSSIGKFLSKLAGPGIKRSSFQDMNAEELNEVLERNTFA